jgi:ElaB/YqjD/DUF883 family membrane-anchored ribosome-binding protein
MDDIHPDATPREAASDLGADIAALKADLARLAESVARLVSEEGSAAAKSVKGRVKRAAAQAEATASQFAEDGKMVFEETRERVASLPDDLAEVVERNPLTSVGIALGLGMIIGMMSRRD